MKKKRYLSNMHIRFVHRLFSLTMAFLLFVSTVGVSMDVHYCQDKVQNYSFIGMAKNCYEKTSEVHSYPCQTSINGRQKVKKKDCCHNEGQFFKAPIDATFDTGISTPATVLPYIKVFSIALHTRVFAPTIGRPIYNPPLVEIDILTRFQQFLI